MRPYGRRKKCAHNLHGERCLICHPSTKPVAGVVDQNVATPCKSRARREAKEEVRREIDEDLATDSRAD